MITRQPPSAILSRKGSCATWGVSRIGPLGRFGGFTWWTTLAFSVVNPPKLLGKAWKRLHNNGSFDNFERFPDDVWGFIGWNPCFCKVVILADCRTKQGKYDLIFCVWGLVIVVLLKDYGRPRVLPERQCISQWSVVPKLVDHVTRWKAISCENLTVNGKGRDSSGREIGAGQAVRGSQGFPKGGFCEGGKISIIGVLRAPVAIINFASNPCENLWVYIGFNKEAPHKKRKINYCKRCAHPPQLLRFSPSQKPPFGNPQGRILETILEDDLDAEIQECETLPWTRKGPTWSALIDLQHAREWASSQWGNLMGSWDRLALSFKGTCATNSPVATLLIGGTNPLFCELFFPLQSPGSPRGGNPRKMGKNYKIPLPSPTPGNGEKLPKITKKCIFGVFL